MNSKNILIEGLHFVGSPMWTIHLLYSENAVVQNVVIETFPGVHADGVVVDSSRFVKLANDYIDTGDDGIVLKSGKDADGIRINRPTEDVTITNCTVHHAQGSVVIGSETSGSVRNVVASNITVKDTVNGIHIKSRRGRGGVVEDIRFNNWTMENVGAAITVSDAGYQMEGEPPDPGEGPVTRKTPIFRNIAVSNVIIDGARSLISLEGISEMPITGLRISNVTGRGRVGLRARYTNDLQISHVQLSPEAGPAFSIRDSANLELDHVSMPKPLAETPVIRLEKTPGAIVRDSKAYPGTGAFISTPPDEVGNVSLQGNVTGEARTLVSANAKEDWPAATPVTKELCLVQFPRDPLSLTRIDNQSRICLDIIAQTLQRSPEATIAIIGNTAELGDAAAADKQYATERARNSRDYLVQEKRIDPSRVQVFIGSMRTDGPENIDKIEAEMVAGRKVRNNVETVLLPKGTAIGTAGLLPIN
jgi:outer membrane protein OmpA-like peptidoglycan-associated protein